MTQNTAKQQQQQQQQQQQHTSKGNRFKFQLAESSS